jgi:hypothetical protein
MDGSLVSVNRIKLEDLMTLEQYDQERPSFRQVAMTHKRNRQGSIGPDIILCFEDRTTILYQIQEMLRTERTFERAGIQEELDAYNPLIPDGSNLKATMMIQIPDVEERRIALARFVGIENCCWIRAENEKLVYAIPDEDMERATTDKTSAVHFLRFEFPIRTRDAIKRGGHFSIGIDHLAYQHSLDPTPVSLADFLRKDLKEPQ